MTYAQAIQFLYDLGLFGTKLGLDNAFRLAALAGNPQNQLRFIHIAGTNGKGSTCAMLESVYRAAGLRLGLYTSPHLVAFGERIQVNRQLISELDITRLVSEMQDLLNNSFWGQVEIPIFSQRQAAPSHPLNRKPAAAADRAHPTFFEVVTVMALRYFVEQKCDLVIWETGMGGRLDATNIVIPLASVITNVQLDHQKWLGDTLAEIASEKAGIIKPRIPVLTAADEPEVLEVIQKKAKEVHSPLTVVTHDDTRHPPLNAIDLPLWGEHQRRNAALALAVIQSLSNHISVPETATRAGLSTVHWPGRLQLIERERGRKILLDGAHNPAGIAALCAALEHNFSGEKPVVVLGVLRDKDFTTMCQLLAPLASRFCLTPVSSGRTADPEVLRVICEKANPKVNVELASNLSGALQSVAEDPFVLITGSLHFIGEAMELLHVSPSQPRDERGLNEWMASP